MSKVKLNYKPKFIKSQRMEKLAQRSRELAISGKRNLYGCKLSDVELLVYGWTGKDGSELR